MSRIERMVRKFDMEPIIPDNITFPTKVITYEDLGIFIEKYENVSAFIYNDNSTHYINFAVVHLIGEDEGVFLPYHIVITTSLEDEFIENVIYNWLWVIKQNKDIEWKDICDMQKTFFSVAIYDYKVFDMKESKNDI